MGMVQTMSLIRKLITDEIKVCHLSILPAVEGVDSLTACEEFLPMAACAEKGLKLGAAVDRQVGMVQTMSLIRKLIIDDI